jgi:hypothetical protein
MKSEMRNGKPLYTTIAGIVCNCIRLATSHSMPNIQGQAYKHNNNAHAKQYACQDSCTAPFALWEQLEVEEGGKDEGNGGRARRANDAENDGEVADIHADDEGQEEKKGRH